MFEYLPGSAWNLHVVTTLKSGALADEVDRAWRPLHEKVAQVSDMGTAESMATSCSAADISHAAQMHCATNRGRSVEHHLSVNPSSSRSSFLTHAPGRPRPPCVEDDVATSLPAYLHDGFVDNRPSSAASDLDGGPVK